MPGDAPPPTGQDEQDRAFYREALHDLVHMGMDLARGLHGQTEFKPPTPEVVASFDRIARTVRRTILLARMLAEAPGRPTRTEARRQIIREVEDNIGAACGDDDRPRAERLRAELAERLDSPDLDDDLHRRPVGEIIEEICRDLGLDDAGEFGPPPPHQRRTPADIAQLVARARRPAGPREPGHPAPNTPFLPAPAVHHRLE